MGIADRLLWPIVCLAALNPALARQRSPRQPQQIIPPGVGINIGIQRPSGRQQVPLVETETRLNEGDEGNFCIKVWELRWTCVKQGDGAETTRADPW